MAITQLQRLICHVIWYGMSSVSLFCSLITPVIIYKMRSWNGTLLLVVSLSLTLGLYSFGLLLSTVNSGDIVCEMQGVIIFFAGLSSALWTTCFSTTLLLLVTGVKFGGINQIYNYYVSVAVGIPLILTCIGGGMKFVTRGYLSCFVGVGGGVDFNGIYNVVIFVCVVYNLIFFIYCWNRIRQMGGKSPTAKALKEACFRMIYYPLVQSFCWFFIWVRYFRSQAADESTPNDLASLLLSCLSSPFFGTLMFGVFLIQQRKAQEVFLALLLPRCVVQYIYRSNSESLLDRDSSTTNISSARGSGSQRGNSRDGTTGSQLGAGDPLDITMAARPSDDEGIIRIIHDEEEGEYEGENEDYLGEESMYSTTQSISMVSRSSSLIGVSPNTPNDSLTVRVSDAQFTSSRTTSDVPIRSPMVPTINPLKSSSLRPNSTREPSSASVASQPVPIASRPQSNALFGNSIASPTGSRQNSIRSPISSVFLSHMLAAQQQQQQAPSDATKANGGGHRVKSVSSSAPRALSLLDESALFDLIQRRDETNNGGDNGTVNSAESGKGDELMEIIA